MKPAQEIEQALSQFYGTEGYTRVSIFPLLATNGVTWLMEAAECGWLVDEIGAAQRLLKRTAYAEMLDGIQFWTLKKEGTKATLICEADTGKVAYEKDILFTDFPLDEIKLYVGPVGEHQNGRVILLPSEY
jgi:hypothetical protein